MRNGIWFELAAAVSLPRLLDAARPPRLASTAQARRVNSIVASLALLLVGIVLVVQIARAPAWLENGRSPAAAAAVAAAAGTDGIVLADDEHADWLLWQQPSLAGRIAYDVRFELFDGRELRQLKLLEDASHPVWRRCGSRVRVVTFAGPQGAEAARREQVLAPGSRTIASSATFIAVAQPRVAAPPCVL